jgi:hypothetical protein
MKYEYYLHRSGGVVFDHFGGIGRPFKVGFFSMLLAKLLGRAVTPCPPGCSERRVYIRAALMRGVHRRSIKMQKIKDGIWDEV